MKGQAGRIAVVLSAAAAAMFAVGGTASAATTQISGSFPNGGCGSTHTVTVSGPSRIEAMVSTTSASEKVYVEIVNGAAAARAAQYHVFYDTPGGGTYGVRVCSVGDPQDPDPMQYTGQLATGPAGQPALPQQRGQVLGVRTTLSPDVRGTAAIRTHSGLTWISLKSTNGRATVRVALPGGRHMLFTGARVTYGSNVLRIAGHGMTLRLAQSGASQRLTIHTHRLNASGWVVQGAYQIIV